MRKGVTSLARARTQEGRQVADFVHSLVATLYVHVSLSACLAVSVSIYLSLSLCLSVALAHEARNAQGARLCRLFLEVPSLDRGSRAKHQSDLCLFPWTFRVSQRLLTSKAKVLSSYNSRSATLCQHCSSLLPQEDKD